MNSNDFFVKINTITGCPIELDIRSIREDGDNVFLTYYIGEPEDYKVLSMGTKINFLLCFGNNLSDETYVIRKGIFKVIDSHTEFNTTESADLLRTITLKKISKDITE